MDAIRTVYAVTLIALVVFIGSPFVSGSTPQSPSPEEIRKHANEGFSQFSVEERVKKHQSGYGQ